MGMPEDFGDWGDEVFLNLCAEDWRDLAPRADAGEVMDRNLDSNFEDRFLDDYDPDRGDDIGQELDMADPDYDLYDDGQYAQGGEYGECTWED